MKRLSEAMAERAAQFLLNDAPQLQKALYQHYFNGAPADDALDALAGYQNGDGGFGHGLEPDIRLGDSSVIATTVAFQHLRDLNTPADHPLVVKGCRYLLDTYDAGKRNWPIIPANIDDAPHAPWWVHNGDLESSKSNPRAEIAGYVNQYGQHFPADMRATLTDAVVDYLIDQPDKLEMHDLLCTSRFAETPNLPPQTRNKVLEKLARVVANTVERDPAGWKNYGLPPLTVMTTPESPFAHLFADEIPTNLDFIIDSQDADGTWKPNWSWGEQWPEAWEEAKRGWTAVLTLDNLRKLRAFGRVGGR